MFSADQLRELKAAPAAPNRVKKAIEIAGITQDIVAKGIGASQPHVTEIANGNYSRLPLETARGFATFFGCTIEDLFPSPEAVSQ